jgi:predicted TIM-barrel fold metal-dependent hydrolase
VATLATDYERWVTAIEHLTSQLSDQEQASIFGGTAVRVYRLRLSSPNDSAATNTR